MDRSGNGVRPELSVLDDGARARVRRHLFRRKVRCGSCGSTGFLVGDALYLGFLFLSERQDVYMVALTCENPRCPAPRTGIRMSGRDFLGRV